MQLASSPFGMGGALYCRTCSVVHVIDIDCTVIHYEVYYSKKVVAI